MNLIKKSNHCGIKIMEFITLDFKLQIGFEYTTLLDVARQYVTGSLEKFKT